MQLTYALKYDKVTLNNSQMMSCKLVNKMCYHNSIESYGRKMLDHPSQTKWPTLSLQDLSTEKDVQSVFFAVHV